MQGCISPGWGKGAMTPLGNDASLPFGEVFQFFRGENGYKKYVISDDDQSPRQFTWICSK